MTMVTTMNTEKNSDHLIHHTVFDSFLSVIENHKTNKDS
jgi:hypothetical protein